MGAASWESVGRLVLLCVVDNLPGCEWYRFLQLCGLRACASEIVAGPQADETAVRAFRNVATILSILGGSKLSFGGRGLVRPSHGRHNPVDLAKPGFNVTARPRVIALWKDARTGVPVEIELPQQAAAAVLNLTVERIEEHTADGRSDEFASGYPVLSGVHFV